MSAAEPIHAPTREPAPLPSEEHGLPPADATVVAELRRRAVCSPTAIAVSDGTCLVTYQTLWEHIERLAGALPQFGVHPGDTVGVAVDRSWQSVACLWAVLRAGSCYVPLDGTYPASHLNAMAESARVSTVLGRSKVLASFPANFGGTHIHVDLALDGRPSPPTRAPLPPGESLAYIIHTSGSSSGRPRPVLVPHRALYNAATSLRDLCAITPEDRVLSFASMSWDTYGEELYGALLAGATLVIDQQANSGSVASFLAVLERRRITVADLPTAYWNEVVDFLDESGARLPHSVRLVIIGGEAVSAASVRTWCERVPDHVRLLNTYGQTETVLVTHAADIGGARGRTLAPADPVPIGAPLRHIRQRVVAADASGRGELAVAGPSLAWGYRGAAAATAAAFVPDPTEDGGRMYLTGDIVDTAADGSLVFVGRQDRQIKVRGIRVEPEEAERMILAHPQVREAAVFTARQRGGNPRLHAAVVGEGLDPAGLLSWLRARLPSHLVPSRIDLHPALPKLPNGKVDRTMLTNAHHSPTQLPDRAQTIAEISELCTAVLDSDCGPTDDFFDAGGDSLLTTRLISKIYRRYDVELTYVDVFEARTPAALADLIHRTDTT